MLAWLRLIGWAWFGGIFFFSMRRPRLLRIGLGFFRRRWPIFTSPFSFGGTTVLVSRADDVREVLGRTGDFLLSPVNRTKILTGDFIIALDPERRYLSERSAFCTALPPSRLRDIEGIVDRAAAAQLQNPANPFDVALFAERITVRIIEEFWGLPLAGARSEVVRVPRGTAQQDVGAETMRLWVRKLAVVLGSPHPAQFGIREAGLRCGEEFHSYVHAACAAATPSSPGMIGHLLRHSSLDVTVRSIAGLAMTGSAVVTKAFTHAFEQLLLQPEALRMAEAAAARGDRVEVAHLLLEALRFNAVFPVLPRYCARPTTLARGTPRETEIPAGANVIASATAAMFDPEAVEDPERFGINRAVALESNASTPNWDYGRAGAAVYLIFGAGDHWCPGDQMALAELGSMGMALLGPRGLRNPRRRGGVRYDGSAAVGLPVRHG